MGRSWPLAPPLSRGFRTRSSAGALGRASEKRSVAKAVRRVGSPSRPREAQSRSPASDMVVALLLGGLAVLGLVYIAALARIAIRQGLGRPSLEAIALGAVTNFFDTLGIGSFAPTTAWIRLRRLVPDSYIPATLNAGHGLP